MQPIHTPVLLPEVIKYLDPKTNQNFIDCTIGGAGHSEEILKRNGPQGKLLGIELDPESLRLAVKKLKPFGKRVTLARDNFVNLKEIIARCGFDDVSGVLLDLGMSSIELERSGRGFSFSGSEPLDMRFDPRGPLKASGIVNSYSEFELYRIFRDFGEEPRAGQIARAIVAARRKKRIKTTKGLVKIISSLQGRIKHKHPATKIFQALRIVVNCELDNLREVLPQALEILEPEGRILVISFHSLEDRIVKEFFKREARDCICPPELPQCLCQHSSQIKILTPKPIKPTKSEIKKNRRCRSARLRVAIKKTAN